MTFHSDALNRNDDRPRPAGVSSLLKPAVAFAATVALLEVIQPASTVVLGAAVITSFAMTFVALLQTSDNWADATSKFDGVYAVLLGFMLIASTTIAGGAMWMTAGLFLTMVFAELVLSTMIAAGVSSLAGMYRGPISIALNIHCRLFGLLGRAV